MAKDKSSFVLYSDLIHLVEQLPDETAGQLLKTILEYVNDRMPEPKDLTLRIAFEPIKRQLKRDLKKYEKSKTRRSAAGKLGGIKSAEARASKAKQNEANPSNASISQPMLETSKQSQANQAVTENVNVNDTVNENVIKTKSYALTFPHGSEEFLKLWGDWVEYREAIRKPYQTFSAQQIELQLLGGYSEAVATQMISNALKNGWKNIRPLDPVPTQPQAGTPGPKKLGA